jgi:hypothetical protein
VPPLSELPHAVIEPSALRAAKASPVVLCILGVLLHPLVMATPRFIQLCGHLPPLKPMDQSRRGVIQVMEAQVHPLIMAIPSVE